MEVEARCLHVVQGLDTHQHLADVVKGRPVDLKARGTALARDPDDPGVATTLGAAPLATGNMAVEAAGLDG